MSHPWSRWATPEAGPASSLQSSKINKVGRAEFSFERDSSDRTYLDRQYVEYPFHITRPLYLDATWPELATLCVQSVSGGLIQGDRVHLKAVLGRGTTVHITTQSATKVHGMERDHAIQTVDLELGPQSYLEYLADPLILFPGSRLVSSLVVRVADGARAIVKESFLHHDPGGRSDPAFHLLASEIAITRPEGTLLALDRLRIERPFERHETRHLLETFPAQGVLYVICMKPPPELAQGLRNALTESDEWYGGVSALPNGCGVYVRLLAPDGDTLRVALDACWVAARRLVTGHPVTALWRK